MRETKVVLTPAEKYLENQSYFVYFLEGENIPENPTQEQLDKDFIRTRVYATGIEFDGHYLVQEGDRKNRLGGYGINPYSDRVLGIAHAKEELPEKILQCTKNLAKKLLGESEKLENIEKQERNATLIDRINQDNKANLSEQNQPKQE